MSSSTTPRISLSLLPAEIYAVILSHVPAKERQQTTQSLRVALPRSPVPAYSTFEHIHIDTPAQVKALWKRLRLAEREKDLAHKEPDWVRSFELSTWSPDADVLINTVRLFPRLQYIHTCIGTTWSPEHLEDLFNDKHPQNGLKLLSMRFRPYVEKATYYQFLKGSYSDSLIEHISRWPHNPSLNRLSIVQDPLPTGVFAPEQSFAQPIVFFSLEPFRPLSTSILATSITHLRLRIPSRPVIDFITRPGSFPSVKVLDLSTTMLGRNAERSLPPLLMRLPALQHLIVDDCTLTREGWRELAKACALGGQTKARARERSLRAWVEATRPKPPPDTLPTQTVNEPQNAARRRRGGRRGLGTSNISLRVSAPSSSTSAPAVWSPLAGGTHTASGTGPQVQEIKYRVLPPVPRLLTFSTSLRPRPDALKRAEWTREWKLGWETGMETLRAVWARLRMSARNASTGVRLVRFDERGFSMGEDEGDVFGLEGLVEVDPDTDLDGWGVAPPRICFGDRQAEGEVDYEDGEDEDDDESGGFSGFPSGFGSVVASGHMSAIASGAATPALDESLMLRELLQQLELGDGGHAPDCGHSIAADEWDMYAQIARDPTI